METTSNIRNGMSPTAKTVLIVLIIAALIVGVILLVRRAKRRAASQGMGLIESIAAKRMDAPLVKPDNGPLVGIVPELAVAS